MVAQDGASLRSLICSMKYSKSNQDGASLRSLISSIKYSKSNQDGASLWSAGRDGKIRRLGKVDGRVEVFLQNISC